MLKYAVIADDFTGACDSGVHFASGMGTALLLDPSALSEALSRHDAVSLSTETRLLSSSKAADKVSGTTRLCLGAGVSRLYKKIDSTLRGNVGAEMEAVMNAAGFGAALVCPAMPGTGRTCEGGRLLVQGVPVHATDAGKDPFNPVSSSDIDRVIALQCGLKADRLPLSVVRSGVDGVRESVAARLAAGVRILIADAVEDSDLEILGAFVRGTWEQPAARDILPVGAGGLAAALAGFGRTREGSGVMTRGRMLAVVGSLTGVTAAQAETAVSEGWFEEIALHVESALRDWRAEASRIAELAVGFAGRNVLVRNAPASEGTGKKALRGANPSLVADVFGRVARYVLETSPFDIVYASGGETAKAVAGALAIKTVVLERECLPGVVVGQCDSPHVPVRRFVVKSGGFGDARTLATLAELFGVGSTSRSEGAGF